MAPPLSNKNRKAPLDTADEDVDSDSEDEHIDMESNNDNDSARPRTNAIAVSATLKSSGNDVDSENFDSDVSDDENDDQFDEVVDESMPLEERLRQQKMKAINVASKREKKVRALKIARDRLTNMKNRKSQNEPEINSKKKAKSKHAPTEVSSKWFDFYRNQKKGLVLNGVGIDPVANRFKPRDPRIDNPLLPEQVNHEELEKNYDFIQEIRDKEIATLKKQLIAVKTTGKKGQRYRRNMQIDQNSRSEIQTKLKNLLHEKAETMRRQVDRAAKRAVSKKMQQNVAEGKSGVYFPKRKELKQIELEAKFDEIRKRGGDSAVDKIVSKRRKKNKSRDTGLLRGKF